MPCNNCHCHNGCNNGCLCQEEIRFYETRRFNGYPYPVPYPSRTAPLSPMVYPIEVCCPHPQRRCNNANPCCNGDLGNKDIFKSATLGNSEILNDNSIPFNFNQFGRSDFIEHLQGDTSFVIKEDGLYNVSFKLNFIPNTSGTISFVLRNNSTPITETFVITMAEAGTYSSISFNDILHLRENSIIDLHFTETAGSVITVVDPLIIFEQID